jgi:hypothetical protein
LLINGRAPRRTEGVAHGIAQVRRRQEVRRSIGQEIHRQIPWQISRQVRRVVVIPIQIQRRKIDDDGKQTLRRRIAGEVQIEIDIDDVKAAHADARSIIEIEEIIRPR